MDIPILGCLARLDNGENPRGAVGIDDPGHRNRDAPDARPRSHRTPPRGSSASTVERLG
jgi:hypothetical protein